MKTLGKLVGCLVVAVAALGATADEVAAGSESEVVLPDGYVRLLYIRSYGLQYIDTGMKLHAPSDVVHMKFMCTKEGDQGMLFGNRVDGTHQAFAAHYNDTTASGLAININNSSISGNVFFLNDYSSYISSIYMMTMEIAASVSGATVMVGDVVCGPKRFTNIDTFETAGNCTVLKGVPVPGHEGGLPNNNGVTGDLYSFSIVSNGVTVLDLIPVRRNVGSGEEVGMFDTLSGQFFGSCGDDPFVAGPDVEQQEEIVIASREGRRIGLSFAPASFVRALYVCYGVADGVSELAKWGHCEKVADVPAGATTANAMLPEGLGKTYAVARFALDVAPDSYTGNLIARYDGIDNVRSPEGAVGHQDGVGLTWANLAGASGMDLGDCEATADGVVYDRIQKGGVAFQTESYEASAVNAIEAVVRIDGVEAGVDGAVWSGASAQLPVPQLRVKDNQTSVVCGSGSANGSIVSSFFTVDKGRAFSVAYVRLGSTSKWATFVNGAPMYIYVDFEPTAGRIEFGNMSTANRGTRGKIYAIRLHSTALVEDQVRANFAVDSTRFADLRASVGIRLGSISPAIGSSSTGVWVTEMTRDASSTPTSATLEFPRVSGRADVYAALAKSDRGESTNGWSVVSKVGTVESGANSFVCDLAGLPCDKYRQIRFFVESTETPSRTYVDDGSLLCWWDGFNYAITPGGGPSHCVQTFGWTDLVSLSHMSFKSASVKVTENGVNLSHKDGQFYLAPHESFGSDDIQTIEVTFTLNDSCSSDGALWGGYSSVDDSPVPQCRVGRSGAAPADFVLGWNSADGVVGNPYYKGNWGDLISVTYVRNGSVFAAYTNGAPTGVSQPFTPQNAGISFAGFSFAPRGVEAVYHSIRLYSKALTPEEIAANYAVDKAWLIDPKPLVPSRCLSIRTPGFALILK